MLRPVSSKLVLVLGFCLGAAACTYFPRPVAGLPNGSVWFSLPLSQWLAEDRAEPEAMAACDECGPGMAVGVVRLSGEQAREAEALLNSPERLVKALSAPKVKPSKIKTKVSARPLQIGSRKGFVLLLSQRDGSKPVYGAAIGQREGDTLHLVTVIGADERAVEDTIRQVGVEHLGS